MEPIMMEIANHISNFVAKKFGIKNVVIEPLGCGTMITIKDKNITITVEDGYDGRIVLGVEKDGSIHAYVLTSDNVEDDACSKIEKWMK